MKRYLKLAASMAFICLILGAGYFAIRRYLDHVIIEKYGDRGSAAIYFNSTIKTIDAEDIEKIKNPQVIYAADIDEADLFHGGGYVILRTTMLDYYIVRSNQFTDTSTWLGPLNKINAIGQ